MSEQNQEQYISIKENLEYVQEKIRQAAMRVGRSPDSIKLLVVTKTHPIDIVQYIVSEGVKYLGENYVEEAQEKIIALGTSAMCAWHMIGHVQSRKAGPVVDNFDYLHSLDSLKLAIRLNHKAQEKGKVFPVLLEFNVGGEMTKSGWLLGDNSTWGEALPDIESILSLKHLIVNGLMTIPPFLPNPNSIRPYYRKLRQYSEYLQKRMAIDHFGELSMGMSSDYEVAIEEGATWIRIGQAILGPRYK